MENIVFLIIIILVGSILQTSTGFGFAIVTTPFMLLFLEPREAVQISIILSIFISTFLMRTIRNDIDKPVLKRFSYGSLIGMPIGMMVFIALNVEWLKITVSFIVLSLTFLLILKFRIQQSHRKDLVIGGFSGLLSTSIAMGGPPIILYFSGTDTTKEKLRGTSTAFFLIIGIISLLIQLIFAGTTTVVWLFSLISIPFLITGLYIGQLLFLRINQHTFQLILFGLLIFTGCYLLVDSFVSR